MHSNRWRYPSLVLNMSAVSNNVGIHIPKGRERDYSQWAVVVLGPIGPNPNADHQESPPESIASAEASSRGTGAIAVWRRGRGRRWWEIRGSSLAGRIFTIRVRAGLAATEWLEHRNFRDQWSESFGPVGIHRISPKYRKMVPGRKGSEAKDNVCAFCTQLEQISGNFSSTADLVKFF